MIRVTVLYPTTPSGKFDLTYYVSKHMKMVKERLAPFGLVGAEVDKGLAGDAPGEPAPFVVIASLQFKSLEGFQEGWAAHIQEILSDVPNYTDITPQLQISEIVG
jgi:uncharacterized protein (TIGR02118 family)